MTSKQVLERILRDAVWKVVCSHVVEEYCKENPNPTVDDVPKLVPKVLAILQK